VNAAVAKRSEFEAFASPFDFRDGGLFELVTVEHARGVVETLLAHCEHLPSRVGVVDYLSGWLAAGSDAETCWHPAFPTASRRIAGTAEHAHDHALAAVALRIAECGRPGAWTFASPAARVRFANAILPCAEQGAFASNGTAASFELTNEGRTERFRFERGRHGWTLAGGDAERVVTLPVIPFFSRSVTLADRIEAISPSMTTTVPLCPDGADSIAARSREAFGIVARYAPSFTSWVGRVIRTIVPRSTGNGTLFSGSASDEAGVIELSFDSRLVSIAEALVHESTHQYLHLATRVASVDDGSDVTLYYSPVKRTGRPIRAILVAYHAFANVVLFYRLCRTGGIDDDGYCARNEEETRAQLAVLEQALRTTRALTDVGEALWRPLARRLAEA
jgi:hypothetical protein